LLVRQPKSWGPVSPGPYGCCAYGRIITSNKSDDLFSYIVIVLETDVVVTTPTLFASPLFHVILGPVFSAAKNRFSLGCHPWIVSPGAVRPHSCPGFSPPPVTPLNRQTADGRPENMTPPPAIDGGCIKSLRSSVSEDGWV